jgi:hypothetical protein
MKNGHNDKLARIHAIPFDFSANSFQSNGFSTVSPWAFGPRKLMKNGHNDMPSQIRAIPFVFSAS